MTKTSYCNLTSPLTKRYYLTLISVGRQAHMLVYFYATVNYVNTVTLQ